MKVEYKLDKSFGSAGQTAGILMILVGIPLTFFHLPGLFLIITGAFVGFSSTSAKIDYGRKRIKFSNNIFGVLPIGTWISITPQMKIGIKISNQIYTTFSLGNRPLNIDQKDFRIILINSDNKEIMSIMKTDSLDQAKLERESVTKQLGLKEY